MKTVEAFAPATIANLSVGFDILGLSLGSVGDQVRLTFNGENENKITSIINGDNLPTSVHDNCCGVVVLEMQKALNENRMVDIEIIKGFCSGSGMGSSSASSAAAAFAFNELLLKPYSNKELIYFASKGEAIACGSDHFDNVAPSIIGGITLVRGKNQLDVLQLPIPDSLFALVFFPEVSINTSDSREVMGNSISLNDVTKQSANLGAFIVSLYESNYDLMSRSLRDYIAEPVRSLFIPKFEELKSIAFSNNAIGFGISGSGPSVFTLCKSKEHATIIGELFCDAFKNTGIKTSFFSVKVEDNNGARILNN